MGLSSNIIWHQAPFDAILEILKSQMFLCSYSAEQIKWRMSELEVAFPMISFCDLPISDMKEYLTHNETNEISGKYGECTIGLNQDWAYKAGMTHVWYLDPKCEYLRQTLPSKKDLLKSLKSRRYPNRWLLLSRVKPLTGSLPLKKFNNYRFYDEKEVRYVPKPSQLDDLGIERVLTLEEYQTFREKRQLRTGKSNGNGIITDAGLGLKFKFSDVKFILCRSIEQETQLREIIGAQHKHIVYMTYAQVVEDIIGTCHYEKTL